MRLQNVADKTRRRQAESSMQITVVLVNTKTADPAIDAIGCRDNNEPDFKFMP
jgi:hypothetical protein